MCRSLLKNGLNIIGFPSANLLQLPKKYDIIEPIPSKFPCFQDLLKYKYDGMDLGRVTAANLTFFLNWEHKLNTIVHREVISRVLKNVIAIYSGMLQILKKNAPDLVYIFNGRFAQPGAVLFACEKLGIHYITHERAGTLNRYYLRHDAIPHDLKITYEEILNLWENSAEDKQKLAEQWFVERRGGVSQGWYSYIKNQKRDTLPENYDDTKINVGIFNGNIEETLTLKGQENPLYPTENEAIEDIARRFQGEKNICFYLRMHPHLSGKNNSQTRELKRIGRLYKNFIVIPPESPLHSYTLMDHCSKVIVFGSTIGVEACFWKKPVILNGRAFYEGLDCAYIPHTREEFFKLITSDLPPKNREGALKYAYWEQRKGIQYKIYKPSSFAQGKFLGKTITPTKLAIFTSTLIFVLFEIKTIADLKYRILGIAKKSRSFMDLVIAAVGRIFPAGTPRALPYRGVA